MTVHHFEMPEDKRRIYRRAVRLEWVTVAYLVSAIVALYLTLGASQAMKAAWLEDLLSLLPPVAFLVASRVRDREPNARFPYGYHRSIAIAFLCASVALTLMGLFLFLDSVLKLIRFEHPSIGTVQPWGEPIWLGWLMLPALLWSAIPAAILGRLKIGLAHQLHDKVLFADAHMNKADWMTAGAAMVGVVGIGVGWWWADAVAAMIIALDILYDGVTHLRTVVADLMDHAPTSVDHKAMDPLTTRIENEMKKMPWVADAQARLREEGHVYFGEVLVVPRDGRDLMERLETAREHLHSLDWKLHDLVLMPVRDLAEHEGELAPHQR